MKMKTIIFTSTLMLFSILSMGQKLEFASVSSAQLDKATAKTGRYAGTFLEGNKINVLYFLSSKKEGVTLNSYNFDSALKFKDFADLFVTREQAEEKYDWYIPKEKIDKVATGNERFLMAGAAFGSGMKIEFGKIMRNYNQGIFTSWDFVKEGKLKPKTGEIWRIQPSGYKTTSDYTAMATAYGFSQDLKKFGFPLLAPATATLLAAGVITEKVKLKGPWTSAGNRVAILAIDGENFDGSKYNIYPLPYTAQTMGSGLGQDDMLSVLFAPHNGPTTVKSLKHFYWKDKKDHFTLMRFGDDYSLVDSVSFISDLMWGRFDIYNGDGATFIVGLGKDGFDGWARNADMIGLKNINAIQITKVENANVIYSNIWNEDMLEDKLIVPMGEKKKYSLGLQNNNIKEVFKLPNGDEFLLGQSLEETYALQVSDNGQLKAFYRIPRIDAKNSAIYNYQMLVNGDDLYLVLNEQPIEFSNQTHVSTSSYTITAGGLATTHTTTTVKRLNEVFVQSQIVRINTAKLEMSNTLVMDGKDFYPMGSYPGLLTEEAIYFTGREKGPKGKVIHLARIDL